jgi:hypothetical protein
MRADRPNGQPAASQSYRLDVLRIGAGEQVILRMLSPSYKGLFTHYVKRRSQYCEGRECNCQHSRIPRIWKGYLAAEQYQQKGNLWLPRILEVTEYLELDFRGRYKRGQVWQIQRNQEKKGETNPVTGVLQEERDERTFPQPHAILDTLRHLYHDSGLQLICDNPMPGRTYVQASQGDPPRGLVGEQPATAEDLAAGQAKIRELLDLLKKLADGMKS